MILPSSLSTTAPLTVSEAVDWRVFLGDLSHLAGAILLRHWRKLDTYERKGAIDLVTIADKECEAALTEAIRRRYPDHRILGEEGGTSGDPASPYRWIIDPLDGTTNFAHGMPLYSVSIAVERDGATIAGAVFAPVLGDLCMAVRGHGATRNGAPIRVSKTETLADALLVTGFPYNRAEIVDWLMGTLGNHLVRSQGLLRLGSAALDLSFVAAGHLDGFYELNLNPWDVAAGALLVEEAGGRMSNFDGAPFTLEGRRMVASNGLIHDEMLRVVAMIPPPK